MSIEFKQTTLPNGLNIIAEINPDAHTSAVGFFTKAGTRDETRDVEGVSHYLEHMMFKGTEDRSADDVNREFDEIGANYNAYTNYENTAYFAQVIPEFSDRAIDLLSDMLRPSLRVEDFDMEKNVILEEIGMYEDHPFWSAYETILDGVYGDHALGYRILGTKESIKALTADQMRHYFETHYGADTITVSLAGKIDFDHAVEMIAKRAGQWPTSGAVRNIQKPPFNCVSLDKPDKRVNRHYLLAIMQGPSKQDEDRYAAAVLSNIIGDDDGSRLYWNLIEPGLADEAEFSASPADHTGTFMTYASCDPKRAQQVEEILLNTARTAAENITEDELIRARSKIAMGLTLQGERPMGRMMSLGSQWTYKKEYQTLDEILTKVQAVTAEDIVKMVEKYDFSKMATIRLHPETE